MRIMRSKSRIFNINKLVFKKKPWKELMTRIKAMPEMASIGLKNPMLDKLLL